MPPPDFVTFLSAFPMAFWPMAALLYALTFPAYALAGLGAAFGEVFVAGVRLAIVGVALVATVCVGCLLAAMVALGLLAGVLVRRAGSDD